MCDIAPETTRSYLTAVAGLLGRIDKVGGTTLAALEQHQVDVYRKAHPGHRANASRFLAWLAGAAGNVLSAGRARRRNLRRREQTVLRTSKTLLDRLSQVRGSAEGRALLAAAVSMVHQVPAITVGEVSTKADGRTVLWPDRHDVVLGTELTAAFDRHASKERLAFAGRNPAQPLPTMAVAYQLRTCNIVARHLMRRKRAWTVRGTRKCWIHES